MALGRLCITDFRNLAAVEVHPAGGVNFFQGANGSGKTSLLEAISILGLGRSFRSRKHANIIRHEQNQFLVFAELQQSGEAFRLGLVRDRAGKSQIRLNDRVVRSAAQLALNFPLQVIDSQAFQLLDGGPAERRHFLDWMVFHVKHQFADVWASYTRGLKQRNSLLRADSTQSADLAIWEEPLSDLAEQIDRLRAEVAELFVSAINGYLAGCDFIPAGAVTLDYQRGWKADRPLLAELIENRPREQKLGFTSVGPHKADIKIRFNRHPATEVLSRGQQKALVAAMYMAQLGVFGRANARQCLLLVDDLPAELDERNQGLLCEWIAQLPRTQVFITGIDLTRIMTTWPKQLGADNCKLFHVKQGTVTEKPCDWSNP
jgi:DNA replication and repair protein RecF